MASLASRSASQALRTASRAARVLPKAAVVPCQAASYSFLARAAAGKTALTVPVCHLT